MKTFENVLGMIAIILLIAIMSSSVYAQESSSDSSVIEVTTSTQIPTQERKIQVALLDFLDFTKNGLRESGTLMKDGVISGTKFVKREIPLVLKELIILRRCEVIIYFFFVIVILLISTWYIPKKVGPNN